MIAARTEVSSTVGLSALLSNPWAHFRFGAIAGKIVGGGVGPVTLTWVSSAGGPLLVAPQSALSLWMGGSDDEGPVETWGDYGRACAVDGYLGLVAIGESEGLVLGDEPATTTYLHGERLFLRWAAADDEDELVAAARQALRDGVVWDEDEDLVWTVDGPVVLFDSAWSGAELESDNHLVIDVEPGRYRVRATYRADGDNWMILVQLQPISES